jgi:recombination protein RecA
MAGKRKATKVSKLKSGDEVDNILGELQDDLNKLFGDDSVMRLDSQDTLSHVDHWVSSRSMVVDAVLRGGRPVGSSLVPFGRMMEVSGPEDCLDGETFIQYETRLPDGTRINHKGGSLEKLFRRFYGMSFKGRAPLKGPRVFTAPSMNDEGRIFQNHIVDVVDVGMKDCFEIVTRSGAVLVATAEHKFFVGTGYQPLANLVEGSTVFLHNRTPYRVDLDQMSGSAVERPQLYLKHHPVAGVKFVEDGKYRYHRLARSRAVIEADMNDLSLDDYVNRLNDNCLDELVFLRSDQHVHHCDENYLNDDLSNLVVLERAQHTRQHAIKKHNNLRYTVVQDVVESIQPVGCRRVFDLKMEAPFNNFIANGLVVHNSGKSTLCAQIAAEVQSKGGLVLITDTEEKIDKSYWAKLGVDLKRCVRIQCQSVREVFDKQYKALKVARDKAPDRLVLMLWDSLGGTSIHDLVDESLDESPMEQAEKFAMRRAKQIGEGVELIHSIVARTRACYLWTNHEYTKIGVRFGSPREVRGGRKPKYYATVRLQLTPVGGLTETDVVTGKTKEYGSTILVKALKNHMSGIKLSRPAFVLSGVGFDDNMTVFETARKMKVITGKSWCEWVTPKGEVVGKFQGYKGFLEKVVPHPEYEDLYDAVLQTM